MRRQADQTDVNGDRNQFVRGRCRNVENAAGNTIQYITVSRKSRF